MFYTRNIGFHAACQDCDNLDTELGEFDAESVAIGTKRGLGCNYMHLNSKLAARGTIVQIGSLGLWRYATL